MPTFNELLSSESMKNASLPKINSNFSNIFNYVYPVGSIYMSINNVSPATLFGGTWEQIKDTFLLSAGDTYSAGSTGGEATHLLTGAESGQKYVATRTETLSTAPSGTGTVYGTAYLCSSDFGSLHQGIGKSTTASPYAIATSDGQKHYHTIDASDASTAHNNMPPYLTVYMWKRTA